MLTTIQVSSQKGADLFFCYPGPRDWLNLLSRMSGRLVTHQEMSTFCRCTLCFFLKYCESKTKEVPKLRSIRVSRTSGRGREIQYKSTCPADFDMSPSKFLGAAYFSWDPSLVSLSNRTAGRGGQQNARVWQTWQGYYLRVLSWSSLNINVFWSFKPKDLFKGKWSLAKSYFKQKYCHACHTRFAVFFPLLSCCVSCGVRVCRSNAEAPG